MGYEDEQITQESVTDAAQFIQQPRIPDKETLLKKAQPVKFHTKSFANGFKVDIEFNFDYKNSHEIDQILEHDSYLRTALRGFIAMVEKETGANLIRDA